MIRRTRRRTLGVLLATGFAAGALGATWTSSASAGVTPTTGPAQAPPPGSGVTIIVTTPQPLGPLSFT